MEIKTILFLQALWQTGDNKDRILALAKESMMRSFRERFKICLNGHLLLLSERSLGIQRGIDNLERDISDINLPGDLIRIVDDMERLWGECIALQIITSRELERKDGINISKIHVVFKPFSQHALKRIREEISFRLYRLLVLSRRKFTSEMIGLPKEDSLSEWLVYYHKRLSVLTESMKNDERDSRWAYELRPVHLGNGLVIPQFMPVWAIPAEMRIPPGLTRFVKDEVIRVSGRGKISNIDPCVWNMHVDYEKSLPEKVNYPELMNVRIEPKTNLDRVFHGKNYMIEPTEYFELINKMIIAQEYRQRITGEK